jgi:hypothetical protein
MLDKMPLKFWYTINTVLEPCCRTRYDWYLIKKVNHYTYVIDEFKNEQNIKLYKLKWLPNSNIDIVIKLLATDEKYEIIQSMSAYEPRKNGCLKLKQMNLNIHIYIQHHKKEPDICIVL